MNSEGTLRVDSRGRLIWPDIPVDALAKPVRLLADGFGPMVLAVPAVRGDLAGEKVLIELTDRAEREARMTERSESDTQ